MPQDRHDDPFEWIDEQSERRSRAGLVRTLKPRPADSPLLDLAGNDYLGLARHPEVTAAAGAAAARWGAGSTGSRLVTGHTELHATLEAELAAFCGFEAALVFSSGYAANLAAVTALSGRDALVLSDAVNHASLIDGCRLSRAEVAVVPHADPEAVRKALEAASSPAAHTAADTSTETAADTAAKTAGDDTAGETTVHTPRRAQARPRRRALVVTDSVFSVDGNAAPLPALAAACRAHGAALVIDDAHGFGVLGDGGRGAPQGAGLAGAPDVVVTVTLSKALGSQGGAVLGPARVIEHLVNSARTFIFDTGLNPAAVGAALASLRLLRREPERAARARALATGLYERLTAAGLSAVRPDASVVSVRAPSPEQAVQWAADCRAAGLAVGCFRPPSVPDGISRLRLTARADLTDQQIEEAADAIVRTAPTA
ncbi:8-amino-7-oxononanoate synthase [Streptomyces sp. NPDC000941]